MFFQTNDLEFIDIDRILRKNHESFVGRLYEIGGTISILNLVYKIYNKIIKS